MSHPSDYDENLPCWRALRRRSQEVARLHTINSLLHWDQQTCQPAAASEYRASQTEALETLAHERWTAPEVGEWLDELETQIRPDSPAWVMGCMREWRRAYERATKLPARLVGELARATALAHEVWVQARKTADFALFAPHLEKLVSLAQEQARCWGGEDAYDAHLIGYEPGATRAELNNLFDELAPALTELVRNLEQQPAEDDFPDGPYPVEAQKAFNREVAEAIGFDFSAGRIDTAAHPFCTTLGPRDIRLTTRYDESDFTSSLLGVLHEAGHGMYEQGLPEPHFGTPAGSAISLGIHESQSRLWENHVGRSRAFWEFWFPRAQFYFPCLKNAKPDTIWRHVNRVRRSFIRVEADPVTYDLHIILRFRLETALIDGSLRVAELPTTWNELFQQLFGLHVPDDAHGCLQDIHWSGASFGYFPTYTLGNLYAAQLYDAAHSQIPRLCEHLTRGEYLPLREWLRKNIHIHGSTWLPADLIRHATGNSPSPTAHLRQLGKRMQSQRSPS